MRSELQKAETATQPVAGTDKYRAAIVRMLDGLLASDEQILAILPFASTLKRPKAPNAPRGKKGKVRVGIYQSWRRYRPLVLTNRRLFVFETGRTPNPREVLASYPVDAVDMVSVIHAGRGVSRFTLEFPDAGRVPFEAGRREREDLAVLGEWLGGMAT